jgi:hypothetical protein
MDGILRRCLELRLNVLRFELTRNTGLSVRAKAGQGRQQQNCRDSQMPIHVPDKPFFLEWGEIVLACRTPFPTNEGDWARVRL